MRVLTSNESLWKSNAPERTLNGDVKNKDKFNNAYDQSFKWRPLGIVLALYNGILDFRYHYLPMYRPMPSNIRRIYGHVPIPLRFPIPRFEKEPAYEYKVESYCRIYNKPTPANQYSPMCNFCQIFYSKKPDGNLQKSCLWFGAVVNHEDVRPSFVLSWQPTKSAVV